MSQFSILNLGTFPPAPIESGDSRNAAPRLSSIQLKTQDSQDFFDFLHTDLDPAPDTLAERELDAALLLLAQRAKFITGASGVAIGLFHEGAAICRSSAGLPCLDRGVPLALTSGLSQECFRTKKSVQAVNSQSDPRLNGKTGGEAKIISALAVPLQRQQEVAGVIELYSERVNAFEPGDVEALERLAHLIIAAIDDIASTRVTGPVENTGIPHSITAESETNLDDDSRVAVERKGIHTCFSCRFPISSGRSLCLDCETRGSNIDAETAPAMFSALSSQQPEKGWLQENIYTLGMIVVPLATIAVLLWLR